MRGERREERDELMESKDDGPRGPAGVLHLRTRGTEWKAEGGGQKDTEMENLEHDHGREWLTSGGRQKVTEVEELEKLRARSPGRVKPVVLTPS